MASAAGAIGGALIAKRATDKASRRAQRGTAAATRAQERMFDRQLEFLREGREQATERLEPFREAGVGALQQYRNLLEDPTALAEDPGLQFLQQQGQRQVESSGAARGMQLSGRQLGNLQERGQGIASQFRGQILGEIGQLINVGQSAAAGQASSAFGTGQAASGAAGQAGTNLANLASQRGMIGAAGALGQGQALATGVTGVADALGQSNFSLGNLFGGQTTTHDAQRLRMMRQ